MGLRPLVPGVDYTVPDIRDAVELFKYGGLAVLPGIAVSLLLGFLVAVLIDGASRIHINFERDEGERLFEFEGEMGDPSRFGIIYWVPMTFLGIYVRGVLES